MARGRVVQPNSVKLFPLPCWLRAHCTGSLLPSVEFHHGGAVKQGSNLSIVGAPFLFKKGDEGEESEGPPPLWCSDDEDDFLDTQKVGARGRNTTPGTDTYGVGMGPGSSSRRLRKEATALKETESGQKRARRKRANRSGPPGCASRRGCFCQEAEENE